MSAEGSKSEMVIQDIKRLARPTNSKDDSVKPKPKTNFPSNACINLIHINIAQVLRKQASQELSPNLALHTLQGHVLPQGMHLGRKHHKHHKHHTRTWSACWIFWLQQSSSILICAYLIQRGGL